MSGQWIVPFEGRNETGVYDLNFLWKSGNVYVMDNHRGAGWCWAREITAGTQHGLLHIDRHTDALASQLEVWLPLLPNGFNIPIDDYLNLSHNTGLGVPAKVIRWDNYLSLYLELAATDISHVLFATHNEGDRPAKMDVEISPWGLLNALENMVPTFRVPFIMNIDLDYFFCSLDEENVRFLDDDYFDRFCTLLAKHDRNGLFPVITIALTATEGLTGGWGPPERLAERMCNALGHKFILPPR